MNSSYLALIIIAAFLLSAAALAIINRNRELKRQFQKRAKQEWGTAVPSSFSAEVLQSIRQYSDSLPASSDSHIIDDITWKDCDFDRIYRLVNHTMSSAGDDVLYSWLRHPLLSEEPLRRRSHLIDWMASHETERLRLMEILYRIGKDSKHSYFASIETLRHAGRIGRGRYLFWSAVTIVLIVLLFFAPVPAVILMIPDFLINVTIQMSCQRTIRESVSAIRAVRALLDGGEQITACKIPELSDYNTAISAIETQLVPFRSRSRFVTAKSELGTGLFDVILEYLNLFFHLDLIQYDQILRSYQGHEEELRHLIELIGTLDAAISAASFREALPYWCHHETSRQTAPETELHTGELYHPLLAHAVPNSIDTAGGNLVTGANASGKSTFLKSVTIGMVLGQSLDTIPAKHWCAPFYRIYTSMALQDNLSEGESYFIVEIRSLKRILDAASQGTVPVFAVVDEVLRGTNTIERIAASAQLLSACANERTLLFAATHDIELTALLEGQFTNYHFSGKIIDRDVHFDYRLKDGPTTERNAIALLKTAGYDEQLAELAEQSAAHFEETGEWKL